MGLKGVGEGKYLRLLQVARAECALFVPTYGMILFSILYFLLRFAILGKYTILLVPA